MNQSHVKMLKITAEINMLTAFLYLTVQIGLRLKAGLISHVAHIICGYRLITKLVSIMT